MPTIKITDATVEPLTLAQAKSHLKVEQDDSSEDDDINDLIGAVRQACEDELQRTLITTTWEKVCDRFSDAVRLEMPRVIAVASVKYIDEDGAEQTLDPADYTVDSASEPAWVVPAYGKAWPATRCQVNAVRVRYTAGYGASAVTVPKPIVQWIKLHLAHYFRNREAATEENLKPLPFASGLLDTYRIRMF